VKKFSYSFFTSPQRSELAGVTQRYKKNLSALTPFTPVLCCENLLIFTAEK
jgi:hypothetical protein